MKRTMLIGALTATAVLLVGCGSKSGTATASSSAPVASSPAVASSAPVSAAPASSPARSAPSSVVVSSAAGDTAAAGAPAGSSVAPTSEDSTRPTTTVGDTSGGLDAQSTVWFTAFCGGMSPVVQLESSATSLASDMSNPSLAQKDLVNLYSSIGTAFTSTAAAVKNLPPPTFPGGPTFAAQTVTAFETSGPVFTAEAKKIAALSVTKDPSSLTTALTDLSDSMTKALAPLDKLGNLKLTPQTQAALLKIPSCAKMQSLAGG